MLESTNLTQVKIPVLVPCYNVEKYVLQCLQSLACQTHKNIEVICIDDGSTDRTAAILNDFSLKDERFKVLSKNNSGYGDSMNKGLSAVTGSYVGIVESDDFIEPTMFEDLLTAAVRNDLDFVRTGFLYYYEKDEATRLEISDFVEKLIVLNPLFHKSFFYQMPAIWAGLYKKEFLDKNEIGFLPTPGASYQDTSFTFKVNFCAKRVMMIAGAHYYYRQHPESSVNSKGKVYCVCDEWEEAIKFASKDPERFNQVKTITLQLVMNSYRWNYDRLSGTSKHEFLKKWTSDLRKWGHIGVVIPSEATKKEKVEYWLLTNFPALYSIARVANNYINKLRKRN